MKQKLTPHIEGEAPLPGNQVLILRLDEATNASNLLDLYSAREMTQVNSPGVVASAFDSNATIGGRSFNGTNQYAGRAASDSDHTVFQGEYGIALWLKYVSTTSTIIEYGEWSSPETQATNIQTSLRLASGTLQLVYERGSGTNTIVSLFSVPVGWNHVGVAFRVDPEKPGERIVDGFLNGQRVVSLSGSYLPPDGGTSSRWIVGASRKGGTAVGVPGSYFQGELDDVFVTKFAPDVSWFRSQYGRGVRDWSERDIAGAFIPSSGRLSGRGGNHWSSHVRVLVNVSGPYSRLTSKFSWLGKVDLDWVDLSSVRMGNSEVKADFLAGPVEWGDNIDDLISTAKFTLYRAWRFFNMSPFVSSTATDGHNPLSDNGEPLLAPMRRVRIETATCPANMRRENVPYWAWKVQFDGFLRSVDVTDETVNVTCADLGVALVDVFMEPAKDGKDRQYGSVGGTAIQGQVDQLLIDQDPSRYEIISIDDNGAGNSIIVTTMIAGDGTINGNGRPQGLQVNDRVVITGTTNYNTPANTSDVVTQIISASQVRLTRTTAGAFAAESVGTMTASRVLSYKVADLEGTPQLWVPVSPLWNVYQWNEPATKPVLQAIDDIVSQIGWRIRYRWDRRQNRHRLALYNPSYFNTLAVDSFSDGDNVNPVLSVDRMSQNVNDTRNIWVVEYYRDAAKDARGNRTINIQVSTNADSIRRYGRRQARIHVGSDSLVNRSNEASALAGNARRDMDDPVAEAEIVTLYDDRWEIGDSVTLTSENVNEGQAPMFFNGTSIVGSVTAIRHSIGNKTARTFISARKLSTALEQPVSRAERYDEIISAVGSFPGRGQSPPVGPLAPTVQNLGLLNAVRAARISWSVPGGDLNMSYLETEVHQSTTAGFTPSAATLAAVVRGTNTMVTGMVAGTTYRVKVIHCDKMGNQSAASPETAYVS